MKKLFAGIVAALALVPVIANAASYKAEDYIDFAGNADDWSSFNAAGSAEETAQFLNTDAVASVFISDTTHTDSKGNKYLKVLELRYSKGNGHGVADEGETIQSGEPYQRNVADLKAKIASPYGYYESSNLVVDIATLDEVKSILGVTGTNTDIEMTDMNKYILTILTAGGIADSNISYVFTKTAGATTGTYKAVKVTRNTAGEVISAAIVDQVVEYTEEDHGYVFTTVEMNEAFTCKSSTTDTYSCYECPTGEENKTDFVWKRDGAQDSACKKVDKITSKAKCVKSPKTGVDSYLVPSAIVLGVCAIVLTVLKRKDAFRTI